MGTTRGRHRWRRALHSLENAPRPPPLTLARAGPKSSGGSLSEGRGMFAELAGPRRGVPLAQIGRRLKDNLEGVADKAKWGGDDGPDRVRRCTEDTVVVRVRVAGVRMSGGGCAFNRLRLIAAAAAIPGLVGQSRAPRRIPKVRQFSSRGCHLRLVSSEPRWRNRRAKALLAERDRKVLGVSPRQRA
jgi:hypothetical protein